MKRSQNSGKQQPLGWIAAVAVIVLLPALLPGNGMYYGTVAMQFVPWRWFGVQALLSGELPLWNPLSGMGAPLVANYQSAFFYPPAWPVLLFGAVGGVGWLAWAQGLLVVFHLAAAGWGMARLVRALGLPALSQAAAGLAYGCSGYLVARSHFLSINAAAAWLPWVLLYIFMLVRAAAGERRSAFFRLSAVSSLLLLAGHAQTAWYTLLLAGLWLLFWLRRSPDAAHSQNREWVLRPEILAVGALVLAVLVAGVQLLPTLELLQESSRAAGVGEDFAMTYSFWPWRLLGFLLPGLFGSPVTGDFWGYANFWEDAVYIGLLPFMMALSAVLTRREPDDERRGVVRFLVGITLVSMVLALGSNTPVFPFLFRYVPTFSLFQAPARWTLWAVAALSILAGYGIQEWAVRSSSYGRLVARRWSAVGIAAALAGAAALYVLPQIPASFGRAALTAGLIGAGAAFLGMARVRSGRWRSAVLGLVALDLAIAGWGLNPPASLDLYRQTITGLEEDPGARIYLPAAAVYDLTFNRFFRFDTFAIDLEGLRASQLPNMNLLDGTAAAGQFDPLVPARYAAWIDALETAPPDLQALMLAEMGVVLLGRPVDGSPSGIAYGRQPARPRVEWFPCVYPVRSEEQALARLMDPNPAYSRFLLIESFETQAEWVCGGEAGPEARGTAEVVETARNRLLVRTMSDSSGWLLVRDTFYPGWQAAVDGDRVEVHPANGVFRAVPVAAGEHMIEMVYRPGSFYLGGLLTLGGLGAGFALARRWHGERFEDS